MESVDVQCARLEPIELALGIATYENAATVGAVAAAAVAAARAFGDLRAAVINADAGSTDGSADLVAAAGLPTIRIAHETPPAERVSVPYHGVPGRGAALRAMLEAAHRLRARALVLLEADAATPSPSWVTRLATPLLEDKADFVTPIYARHRYEGTITRLLVSPLVRALYGRRLHQPIGGQQALSGRLIEHLLIHPKWDWTAQAASDLWMTGTAIADGFAVGEAWLGSYAIRSRTRSTELPTMIAQTLGGAFAVMDRHEDLWLEVRGSEPVEAVGEPTSPPAEAGIVEVDALLEGFVLGLRDLVAIWQDILAPETFGDVLTLDAADATRFAFPDDLWARVVYDFALGHHYRVVHREHLLRSLVPLYLGKTAAFALETRHATADRAALAQEGVGAAFERQKPYLVEHWR